jgi:hypothetical protein
MTKQDFQQLVKTIDPNVSSVRFDKGCSMMNCDGSCCRWGVWADLAERDEILKHTDLVHKYMDPDQDHDPAGWFDSEVARDADFPSGTCVGTQTHGDRGCVFLNSQMLCVLQKAEIGENDPNLHLKPFYCRAFPIAIQDGAVIFDDFQKDVRIPCCSEVAGGELTASDVLGYELDLVLGEKGAREFTSTTASAKT